MVRIFLLFLFCAIQLVGFHEKVRCDEKIFIHGLFSGSSGWVIEGPTGRRIFYFILFFFLFVFLNEGGA